MEANAEPEVVLAAFLHDIGHLCAEENVPQMEGYGIMHHEQIGADFLRAEGVPERVARLAESHVQFGLFENAKNYYLIAGDYFFLNKIN